MVVVFEDNKNDRLSRLYEMNYPKSISDKFVYTNGRQRIQQYLDNISHDEEVVVFVDVCPDNPDTYQTYNSVQKQIDNKRFKNFIVLPIPCREYYYIKALQGTQVEVRRDWVKEALSRLPFQQSTLLDIPKEKERCTNFEKFCKRVAYNQFKYCTIKRNKLGYFDVDCVCGDETDNMFSYQCKDEDIKLKLVRILAAFPCFPANSNISEFGSKVNKLDWVDIQKIHRQLVSDYNAQVKAFRDQAPKVMTTFYKDIEPMC